MLTVRGINLRKVFLRFVVRHAPLISKQVRGSCTLWLDGKVSSIILTRTIIYGKLSARGQIMIGRFIVDIEIKQQRLFGKQNLCTIVVLFRIICIIHVIFGILLKEFC